MQGKMPNPPPKTHPHPLPIPGPVELTVNYEAGWLAIATPEQIPFEYLPAVIFSLQQIDMERKKRMCTTRKIEGD